MYKFVPIRFLLSGDIDAAKGLIGPAKSQMEILKNQMRFQGLQQGVRKITLPDGGFIVCQKCFNLQTTYIHCSVTKAIKENIISSQYMYLSIIFGSPEEKIIFQYIEDTGPTFLPDGDAVFCSDEGSGFYNYVSASSMYGQFTKCFEGTITSESNEAIANIIECKELVYERIYNVREVFSNFITNINSYIINSDITRSAYDVYPITDVSCKGNPYVENVWSKTYDDLIVTAISYMPPDIGATLYVWQVSISYKDKILTWGRGGANVSPTFARQVCVGDYCLTKRKAHIGFDVWADKNAEGKIETYHIGLIGEQEAILYKYSYIPEESFITTDWSLSLEKTVPGSSIWAPDNFIDSVRLKRTLRLVGYGFDEYNKKHLVYWALWGSKYYGKDEISITQDITTTYSDKKGSNGHDMLVVTGLWNPITKKPFFVWDTAGEEYTTTGGTSTLIGGPTNYIVGSIYLYACDLCTNGSATIEHDFVNSITVSISMPTIQPPSGWVYGSYRAESTARVYAGDYYDRGNFVLGELSLYKGQRMDAYIIFVSLWSSINEGISSPVNFVHGTDSEGIACVPLNMKEYSFSGGVFDNDNFTFKYLSTSYVTEQINENETTCIISDTSDEHFEGKEVLFSSISTDFPYDDSWRSILLHGYCRIDDKHENTDTEISNLVIYKNTDSSKLFMLDNLGNKHDIGDDGNYYRAFFKQQHITVEGEI